MRNQLIIDLAEKISKFTNPILMEHAFLMKELECKLKDINYYSRIQSLKKRLMTEYSIYIEPDIAQKGYRVISTNDSGRHVNGSVQKRKHLLLETINKFKYVPLNKMSEQSRNETLEYIQKEANLNMLLSAGSKVKQLT